MPDNFRERAHLICQTRSGQFVSGPTVTGTRDAVPFPETCPPNSTPYMVSHTHPPDDSILPSHQDVAETRRRGLVAVCVNWRGQERCYLV